ncbi:DNA-directed RNA polymerase I subunit rpa49 like [Actinidia chinensis var. chinensis]|uniref:DNA-directed RNA polymerase I subunit rpa49 like n=1 Tax=Actinidia chinensis var. chinensis TaxID=1590841 RepID=A0A2R6R0C1_ACTCC|nr:DNA-directed RNA polymerase I subunit rpa49 like [Actinidia chinensis var. chinensis]
MKPKKKKKKKENIDVTIETLSEHPNNVSPVAGFDPHRNHHVATEEEAPPLPEVGTAETEEKPETLVEEDTKPKKKKKKKKKNEENIDVKIQTLGEHPNKISPFVGYFPSGFDPLRHHQVAAEEEGPPPLPEVRVFRHEKRTSRLQLVVSPNGSQVDFVGTNYSGEATAPQLCTYALGVLDKQSQTLKIVPIASNKIFRLEPRVGGSDLSNKETSKEEPIAEEEPTAEKRKADKIRDLTFMYSTKKTINQAKKRESLQQKEDPETQEDLDKKIEGVKINKEALESASSHSARNIPPHDSSAITPQTAYPLDKIIFSGEWDYLLDILELLQFGAELASDDFPTFVCNRLHRLEHIEDEVEKKTLACVFSYINHLIKFKDRNSIGASSSVKFHKIPTILSQKFSTLFADSDAKWLADDKKDLLISYVLVLTLIADGFRSDPSDIARDLKMTAITIRPHYEHLGCKLVREGRVLLATLPVPLQFPRLRGKRRR